MIKTAVVGLGFIGQIHLEALRRIGGVDIIAVADADSGKAERTARRWNVPAFYGSWKDLLQNEEFDVLHNCTPNSLHFDINAEVIKSGRHIFSEKPLAMNTSQSRNLCELAEKNGVLNAVGFNYRFNSLIQELRHRMIHGEYGRAYCVHGSYLQDWLLFDTDYNWRVEKEHSGDTRAVSDIGSHWCDMAQYLTGARITRVMANLKTVIPVRKKPTGAVETFSPGSSPSGGFIEIDIPTDDCGYILFEMDSGAGGMFMVSQVSAGRKCYFNIEINCEHGSVRWNQEDPERVWIGRRGRPNEILIKDQSLMHPEAGAYVHAPAGHPEGYLDGVKNLFICFYNTIVENNEGVGAVPDKAAYPTFRDAHGIMNVCEAIAVSNRERRWIDVIS